MACLRSDIADDVSTFGTHADACTTHDTIGTIVQTAPLCNARPARTVKFSGLALKRVDYLVPANVEPKKSVPKLSFTITESISGFSVDEKPNAGPAGTGVTVHGTVCESKFT